MSAKSSELKSRLFLKMAYRQPGADPVKVIKVLKSYNKTPKPQNDHA